MALHRDASTTLRFHCIQQKGFTLEKTGEMAQLRQPIHAKWSKVEPEMDHSRSILTVKHPQLTRQWSSGLT
jgi:hypothetical protein